MWFEKQASYGLNMGRGSETEPSARWDKFKFKVSVGGNERKAFTVDLGCIGPVIRKPFFLARLVCFASLLSFSGRPFSVMLNCKTSLSCNSVSFRL